MPVGREDRHGQLDADSAVGDMFRAVGKRVPPPPGVRPAVAWGTRDRVTELLGAGCRNLRVDQRTCPWRYPSAAACLEYFQTWYGPVVAAFTAVGDAGRKDLEGELVSVFESHNVAHDGTLAMDVAYLEAVGVKA